MRELEEARKAIDRARDDVENADVRTQLDSIGASLEEMIDTEAGIPTDSDDALGDTEFEGAAPRADHLVELEKNLEEQADQAEQRSVRDRLETARQFVAAHRSDDRGP